MSAISFWRTCVDHVLAKFGADTDRMTDKDFRFIKEAFEHVKGSWVGLAEGDADQWSRLHRVCKVVVKERGLRNSE